MRTKMSIENRAKQFMPFSALPGLEDALAAAEAEAEIKASVSYAEEPSVYAGEPSVYAEEPSVSASQFEPDPGPMKYKDPGASGTGTPKI